MPFRRPKSLALLILLLLSLTGVTGCLSQVPENNRVAVETVHLINPIGPAVIPVAGIESGNVTGDIKIDVAYWKTVDEAIGLLSADSAEFAVLPITTGVNMVASGIDMALLAVHEWKVFYLIACEGHGFSGWDSLKGNSVYTPGAKGQTVDVLTRYALGRAHIVPDEEVTFVYAPAQEIVALFSEGKIDYAALPEPYVTQALSSGKGEIVLDYQEYWSQVNGTQHGIPIAGVFVTTEFRNGHPDVVEAVAGTIARSTQWANDNPDAAIEAKPDVLPLPPEVIREALRRILFEYVPATEAEEEVLEYLKTMRDTYPDGIKAIPDETFFVK